MSIKLLPANQLVSLTKLSTNLCNCSVLNVFHVRCAAQTFDRPSFWGERYHGGLNYSEPYYSDHYYIKLYYSESYYSGLVSVAEVLIDLRG